MNLEYITHDDWQKVFKRYPGAEDMLRSISLERELPALKRELAANVFVFPGRRTWVINRIKELEHVFGEEWK